MVHHTVVTTTAIMAVLGSCNQAGPVIPNQPRKVLISPSCGLYIQFQNCETTVEASRNGMKKESRQNHCPGRPMLTSTASDHRDHHQRDRRQDGEPGGVGQRGPYLRVPEGFLPVRQAHELRVRAGEARPGEAHPQAVDRGPDEEYPEREEERRAVQPAAQVVRAAATGPADGEAVALQSALWRGGESFGGGHRSSPSTDGQVSTAGIGARTAHRERRGRGDRRGREVPGERGLEKSHGDHIGVGLSSRALIRATKAFQPSSGSVRRAQTFCMSLPK